MGKLKSIIIGIEGEVTLQFGDPEEDIKSPEDFLEGASKGLSDFLQEMFVQENMTAEEKERILNMTVMEFCTFCSTIKEQPAPELKLTRAEFMSNMSKVPCGICHSTNALTLVDGTITCKVCGATLGDIDDYPIF
ncbi:MAG: hypothetical protein RR382_00860 [Tannerellaceae bacterium]